MPWPFADRPNVAVFTTADILAKKAFIALVVHDADDGSWQFLPWYGVGPDASVAKLVALQEVVAHDNTVRGLADLPLGWRAWRGSPSEPWQRGSAQ